MKGAKQLRDMIYSILENSNSVSGVTLKNSPNSSELLLDQANGKGRMTFHTLFPGLTLAFIFVNAPVWPESEANSELRPLLINYCISGRSELLLDDGSYIYLKEKQLDDIRQACEFKVQVWQQAILVQRILCRYGGTE